MLQLKQKESLFNLVFEIIKKLVLVSITHLSITVASNETELILRPEILIFITNTFLLLKRVPCIYYPVQLKKNQINI